jgi:cobalamin biosynthesis protein CobD/CbiB
MVAMAGALRVGLRKRGAYRLGTEALPWSPDAVCRARRVVGWAAVIVVALVAGVALLGKDGSA